MNKIKYYKYLFIISAFFNWANALSFFFLSVFDPSIFLTFGTLYPPTLFFLHALLGLIFTYGIGYYIVGRDINKNHGVVVLGVVSKLVFFSCCVIYFLLGDLAFIMVVFGSFDFIFACLFVEFLINFEKIN